MSKTVILVHGTFAAPKPGVTQWYELGKEHDGGFVNLLERAVREQGDPSPIEWRVFSWSGANVHEERLAAAEALYAEIKAVQAASPADDLFLIAHSHGGNVGLKALELLWRRSDEAGRVFDALLRAVGIELLTAEAAASHVIASSPTLSGLSVPLRKFLNNAAMFLSLLVRLQGRVPAKGSDPASQERWLAATRRSPLVGRFLEPFSMRWSAERRPSVHLITLGTPFFQKVWKPPPSWRSPRVWLFRPAAAGLAAAALCSVIWAVSIGLAALGAMTAIPVSSIQQIWMVASIILYLVAVFVRGQHRRGDTNLYFDIDSAFGAILDRATRLPWRISVIHAGLLDEALLALSAEPLIFAELAPRLRKPLAPQLSWRLTGNIAGQQSPFLPGIGDLAKFGRLTARLAVQWGYNVTVGLAFRFFGWVTALLAHQLLLRALLRSINTGGTGIPEDELRDARIDVVSIPSLKTFFEQEVWDATQALVDEPPAQLTTADRRAQWGFLWDRELLTAELSESQIWKRISPAIPLIRKHRGAEFDDELWLQRVSVAVEERLREASGLVPLNHSGYYSNRKVIRKLSELLSNVRDSN